MYKYFDESYRKDCRKQLVNYIYNKLKKTKCPTKIWAFIIKACHFTFPYLTLIVFLSTPIWIGIITLFMVLFFLLMYIYLKGCFVSHLEYKLNKKNFINIVDPYLILIDYPINNESRYIGTFIIGLFYFSLIILILYIRLKWINSIKN